MAIYKRDIVDINLETGNIHRSFLKHSIGYLDQAADHFGIRVLRNGEPVDLTGVTVQGIFMPPQGNPIAITTGNIIEGNVAEVVLPQACYNYDGQFCLSIKLVDATNAITGTMRIVDGMVDNTHASGTVAPTGSVPTYQEILAVYDDMVDALADVASYAANFAPEFVQGTANAAGSFVMNDGVLYLLPDGHTAGTTWANTTKTQANVGGQLSDLKSALHDNIINSLNEYTYIINWAQGTINSETGKEATNPTTTRIRTSLYYRAINGIHLSVASGYKVRAYKYNDVYYTSYQGLENNGAWLTGDVILANAPYYKFIVANADDTTDILPSAGSNVVVSALYDNQIFDYSAVCNLENGALYNGYGSTGNSYASINTYRRTDKLIKVGNTLNLIEFDAVDFPYIDFYTLWEYGEQSGEVVFIQKKDAVYPLKNQFFYTPSSGTKYIKLNISPTTEGQQHTFGKVTVHCSEPVKVCFNPNISHVTEGILYQLYRVSGDTFTSGQLMLPPNYSVEGKPVPLYVYCHGTGGMDKWDTKMNIMGDHDLIDIFQYYTNEGFTVFDCYPWTTKYYSTARQISPFMVAPNEKAYVEGIKYICSHFNVDISNVCVSGLSLGGNMSTWFMFQTEIPVKAIAMLAPTTGWASWIFMDYFLEDNARNLMVNILHLENETDASYFVNQTDGMNKARSNAFVQNNLDAFTGLNPAALGVNGCTFKNQFDWMLGTERTLPQWMVDEGLPEIPSGWLTNPAGQEIGIPQIVDHPNLSKFSPYPIKFWQAFDDVNVSGHANYTIYNWLKNGGTKVYWRTLASGHGGHGAIGQSPLAEKTSGTTHLGISYTDVPVAQVEMMNFFYDQMDR